MSCHICQAAGFVCGKCRQEKENDSSAMAPGTYRYGTTQYVPKVDGPRYGERRK